MGAQEFSASAEKKGIKELQIGGCYLPMQTALTATNAAVIVASNFIVITVQLWEVCCHGYCSKN